MVLKPSILTHYGDGSTIMYQEQPLRNSIPLFVLYLCRQPPFLQLNSDFCDYIHKSQVLSHLKIKTKSNTWSLNPKKYPWVVHPHCTNHQPKTVQKPLHWAPWAPALHQPMAPPLQQRLRCAVQDAVALPVVAALHRLQDLRMGPELFPRNV